MSMKTRIDKELMDIGVLGEGFTLSGLWLFREDLVYIKTNLEEHKEQAIYLQMLRNAVEIEKQLYFVNRNIELVESVMMTKELDVFVFTDYDEISLN